MHITAVALQQADILSSQGRRQRQWQPRCEPQAAATELLRRGT
jgi:hypothetical protein